MFTRGDEGVRDGAGLRGTEAQHGAQGAAEGVGGAFGIDAVLLELVQEIGAGRCPGEPRHVAPPARGAVAAQRIGRQQDKQHARRTEADPRPDKGESEHPGRG
jgi:hypothetical protein